MWVVKVCELERLHNCCSCLHDRSQFCAINELYNSSSAIILAFHPLRTHGCCSQNLKSLCARQNCVPRFCLWTSSSHKSRHLQQPLSRTEWIFLPFSEVYGRTDDDHQAKLSGKTLSTRIIVSINLWRIMRGVACYERFARISAVAKNREAIMAGNEEKKRGQEKRQHQWGSFYTILHGFNVLFQFLVSTPCHLWDCIIKVLR